MIYSDMRNGKGLQMEGNVSDVSAECVMILRELYKRNREKYSEEVAAGILTNMVIKAIVGLDEGEVSEEEKLGYTE